MANNYESRDRDEDELPDGFFSGLADSDESYFRPRRRRDWHDEDDADEHEYSARKTKLAPWMKDASLLPKKPPGGRHG